MGRSKKDGHFLNLYIDRKIYERLKKYAENRDQTMTRALERLLEKALDDAESATAQESSDDVR